LGVELLVWPALVGYGQAAVAFVGEARKPGPFGRAAIWSVRLGWLAQTGLLVAQAAGGGGFPWSTRFGALNLLVWLVVGTYLIWGCSPRFRLLGLCVMPASAALLVLAYAGGGLAVGGTATRSALLAVHVALVLAAFAGFALGGGLAALYLWQERRLKRRERRILRLPVPPLEALDRLVGRTAAAALVALTLGILLGIGFLVRDGGRIDAGMTATVAAWLVYASLVVLRGRARLHGRRAAHVSLAGLALVVVTVPLAHFAS
jgi:ABC-type uncharacterized transport system permease subunit